MQVNDQTTLLTRMTLTGDLASDLFTFLNLIEARKEKDSLFPMGTLGTRWGGKMHLEQKKSEDSMSVRRESKERVYLLDQILGKVHVEVTDEPGDRTGFDDLNGDWMSEG